MNQPKNVLIYDTNQWKKNLLQNVIKKTSMLTQEPFRCSVLHRHIPPPYV